MASPSAMACGQLSEETGMGLQSSTQWCPPQQGKVSRCKWVSGFRGVPLDIFWSRWLGLASSLFGLKKFKLQAMSFQKCAENAAAAAFFQKLSSSLDRNIRWPDLRQCAIHGSLWEQPSLCYPRTMGTTGCSAPLKMPPSVFSPSLFTSVWKIAWVGRGSELFVKHWIYFFLAENVSYLGCVHYCNMTFSYLSC